MSEQHRLLLLADTVASIDADLGSAQADAWLVAAIDSVANALVDLADGSDAFAVPTRVHVPVAGSESEGDVPVGADRASCAAAASALRQAQGALSSLVSTSGPASSGLAATTDEGIRMIAGALQDIASEPSTERHRAIRAGAHRSIRAAYRLLQPQGSSIATTSESRP